MNGGFASTRLTNLRELNISCSATKSKSAGYTADQRTVAMAALVHRKRIIIAHCRTSKTISFRSPQLPPPSLHPFILSFNPVIPLRHFIIIYYTCLDLPCSCRLSVMATKGSPGFLTITPYACPIVLDGCDWAMRWYTKFPALVCDRRLVTTFFPADPDDAGADVESTSSAATGAATPIGISFILFRPSCSGSSSGGRTI